MLVVVVVVVMMMMMILKLVVIQDSSASPWALSWVALILLRLQEPVSIVAKQ